MDDARRSARQGRTRQVCTLRVYGLVLVGSSRARRHTPICPSARVPTGSLAGWRAYVEPVRARTTPALARYLWLLRVQRVHPTLSHSLRPVRGRGRIFCQVRRQNPQPSASRSWDREKGKGKTERSAHSGARGGRRAQRLEHMAHCHAHRRARAAGEHRGLNTLLTTHVE